MKRIVVFLIISCLCCSLSLPIHAQFGGIKVPKASDAKKAIEKELKEEKKEEPKEAPKEEKKVEKKEAAPAQESKDDSPSGNSSRDRRRGKGEAQEALSADELTPNKLQFILMEVYEREVRYMFTDEKLAQLQNFDRAAYDAKYGKSAPPISGPQGNSVKSVNKILEDYDAWLERDKVLDEFAKYRYQEAQNSSAPADKLKAYNQVITACKIIEKISPNNKFTGPKQEEVKKLIATVEKSMGAAFTSDYHREHVNQMVFSSKPFKPGEEAKGDIRNSFKAGETVYATIYLGRKVRAASDSYAQQPIEARVDGSLNGLGHVWITTPMQENTYLQFPIIPGEDWLKENYKPYLENNEKFYQGFIANLAKALPVKHEIKISFDFRAFKAEQFEESFTYDLSNGVEHLEALSAKLTNQGLASVKIPTANMSNAALEKEMLEICKKKFSNDTWFKAVIVSKDWKIQKNDLTGAILGRELLAAITYKNFGGECGFEYVTFEQEYTGAGKYSNTLRYRASGGGSRMSCDNIK